MLQKFTLWQLLIGVALLAPNDHRLKHRYGGSQLKTWLPLVYQRLHSSQQIYESIAH